CAILGLSAAAEFFATTEDVYVTLGDLPEEPGRVDTADGRPLTKDCCRARLARMECDEDWSPRRAEDFARGIRQEQARRIAAWAMVVASRLPEPLQHVVCAGAGEFLIRDAVAPAIFPSARLISLTERLSPALSTAACAHAIAVLAAEDS